jgi:hypothetical protein
VERDKWAIQKIYNVLPTDERYLALTRDQIALIFAHMKLDRDEAKRGTEKYDETAFDPEYEDWEEKVLNEDGGYFG